MTRNRGAIKLILIGLVFVVSTSAFLYAAIPAEERLALIALYKATNGDNWENNSGWKTPPLHTDGFAMPGTEKDWYGIKVSGGHVTYLSMNSNFLEGNIPPEIGNLKDLICLYLDNNKLSGTIPSELGNLSKLYRFYLNDNQLTGNIPGEIFDLSASLKLYSNKLTGELPLNVINFKDTMDIKYNCLYTSNPDIRIFLNERNKGWEDTQTIAPANVSSLTLSTSSIKISWNPILYQDDTGDYEIYFSTTSGGPWLYAGRTENKSTSYYTVSGLNPGTRYFFRVRTITHPHINNANEVISEYSDEVSATTDTVLQSCVISFQSTPSNGVTIVVTPIDNTGRGNGITKFNRTYYKGTTVTLTAPETYDGKNFLKWIVNGVDNVDRILEITVYDDYEITAVYGQANVDITVTTTEDNVSGSLRDAITKANTNNKDTTIILPEGIYYLYGADNEDNNQSGDLDINSSKNITITGEGIETTVIDGSRLDRVLHVINGSVSISGVTIRNGKTREGQKYGEDGQDGSGIHNSGNLSLTNCSIDNNKGGKGYWGAVTLYGSVCPGRGGYGGGVYNSGSLTLIECTIKNNSAGDCGGAIDLCSIPNGGHGGGIFNSFTGTQVLKNCTISNNTSGSGYDGGWDHDVENNGGDGGGIYNEGIQKLIDCTINSNATGIGGCGTYTGGDEGRSGRGGGIYNCGDSTLKNSIIRYNTTGDRAQYYNCMDQESEGDGGAIYNSGTLNLTNCTISNNNTGSGGSGGGIYHYLGTLTLTNCSINKNSTGKGLGGEKGGNGAGIFNGETLILTNCTVSSNNTGNGGNSPWSWIGGGNGGGGGGIFNSHTITVTNCTICNNTTGSGGIGADDPESEDGVAGYGGGIYNDNGTINIKNTIVANNRTAEGGEGPDCWGTLNSKGYNLIKNTTHCVVNGIIMGNITEIDPMLGPLSDNGGPTQTHALLPGSPAIDAGNSIGISKDQRGYPRPIDIPEIPNVSDSADIGAYELNITNYISISGKITCDGIGLVDVTLTFSNNGEIATTDQDGNYTQYVPSGWTGTVTPIKDGYMFTPTKRDYTLITGNQINQDYIADLGASSFFLNVQSVPGTGVSILTSPNDNNGEGDGNTNFTRLYTSGTTVTLTAPGTHNGKEFSKWTMDGIDTIDLTIQVTMNSSHTAIVYYVTPTPSEIALNRSQFNFGKKISGAQTNTQTLLINNRGGGTLNWTTSPSESWIHVNPSSGIGNGEVAISIDGTGLSEGTYTGTITVSEPDASNSPQTVHITLTVYSSTTSPFGTFETPLDNSTVRGSIPVTGWALDDIGVESVKIYRKENSSLIYIGDTVLVEGARPDVEEAYPDYPNNFKAGWGYMLLTNALPYGGNGTFTLYAKAKDIEGNSVTLGTKTIICDNANAVKPFGAIDTPTQGGAASGSKFINWGWALTPQPNTIPTDGSTIDVWVDGVNLGHPTYNIYREDIATLFPGYNNSNDAVGYFCLDTTTYENGVHTIAWSVADDAGNKDGIGSRYFSIENSHGAWSMEHGAERRGDPARSSIPRGVPGISNIPVSYSSPVEVIKGFNRNGVPLKSYPDENGNITIKIQELERVEIYLDDYQVKANDEVNKASSNNSKFKFQISNFYSGFQVVRSQIRSLPPGSYLDRERGIFYWLPGPGFIGSYRFLFIIKMQKGEIKRKEIQLKIIPKLLKQDQYR